MKITVVTVAYNAERTIADTVRSVAAQTHAELEHLVIDGASTDRTVEVVRDHAHSRLRLVSEPDAGLYDAMNKGLAQAGGDLVGFLNADDFFCRSDALALLAAAARDPAVDAVAGAVAIVAPDDPGRVLRAYRAEGFRPWMLRFGHVPPHPGFYVRRAAAEQVGPFDPGRRISGDFEWMLKFFLRQRLRAALLPQTLVGMRAGGLSTRGLAAARVLNREAHEALQAAGFVSSPALIWAKYPAKALQLLRPAVDYPAPAPVRWTP